MWEAVAARWFQIPNVNIKQYGVSPDYWTGDNLGDHPLNNFLLPKIFPDLHQNVSHPKYILLGCGSILGTRSCCMSSYELSLPLLVYGSGYQYGKVEAFPDGSKVFCVRGKYTCENFGLEKSCAVADPAVMLPQILPRDVESTAGKLARIYMWKHERYRTLWKPSYWKPRYLKGTFIQKAREANQRSSETGFADVFTARTQGNLIGWLRRLWSCEKIETEAMHPAIVADAYGIPWKPLKWEQKWQDHFSMLGINEQPKDFILSDRKKLEQQTQLLWQRRDDLCDYVDSF